MQATATPIRHDDSHNDSRDPVAASVIDATVVCLSSYESLAKLIDFKKVRATMRAEVERVGDGAVHLTPLFVYLWAVAKPWYATGDVMACVREIASSLERRGVLVKLPDAYRFPAKGRTAAARAPEVRAPMGTRARGGRQRLPLPARDVWL